ncbi:MAG: hypothetical protein Q9213_001153 [Squamulea squamosa]
MAAVARNSIHNLQHFGDPESKVFILPRIVIAYHNLSKRVAGGGLDGLMPPTTQRGANFEQVKCPKALTEITGCSRNDEQLQLDADFVESSHRPPIQSPSPVKAPIGTNVKIAIAVCVAGPLLTSAIAVCWYWRRRKANKNKMAKNDNKPPSEIIPATQKLEPVARSENVDLDRQELFPAHVQRVGSRNLHEVKANVFYELGTNAEPEKWTGSRGGTVIKYDKPLPNLPIELKGSSICKELEGNLSSPWTWK